MKKIIAVIVALVCVAVLFNINAFADNRSFELEYIQAVYDYAKGDISYSEYLSRSSQLIEQYADDLASVSGIKLAMEIENTIEEAVAQYGDAAINYVGDWLSDVFGNYEKSEDVPNTDKYGYGTKIVARHKQYNSIGFEACWDGYIEI